MTDGVRPRLVRALIVPLYRLAFRGRWVENIFQNPDDLQELRRIWALGGRREACHLIRGSGVSAVRFAGQQRPHSIPVVLMATRVNVFKGVHDFVEAARLLRARGLAVEFQLAGTPDRGNMAEITETEILSWVEAGLIRYLGHQERMEDVLAGADIVVLPSMREGAPRILIEAAAMKKAIVATNVPGCREIVRHGENGLLVPPRHPQALAAAIETLLAAPALRVRMGEAGRAFFLEHFEQNHVVQRTLEVYALAAAHRRLRHSSPAVLST